MKKQHCELLLRTLETEMDGIVIYSTALKCVLSEELRREWTDYLDQSGRRIEIIYELFESLALDTEQETPGRLVVRHMGQALVDAIEIARFTDDPTAAELVACECVVLAKTRTCANWQL
ncbi:MAG: hypothetical protein ABI882_17390, partial [Acidobacteriota bacterium]